MVSNVTEDIQSQKDKIEALSPTIPPLQEEIAMLKQQSADLKATIEQHKAQVAMNARDKIHKDDQISATSNDIKILKHEIESKKAEIEPLPGKIEVFIFVLVNEYVLICLCVCVFSLLLFLLSTSPSHYFQFLLSSSFPSPLNFIFPRKQPRKLSASKDLCPTTRSLINNCLVFPLDVLIQLFAIMLHRRSTEACDLLIFLLLSKQRDRVHSQA